jgi:hypothetical protein
LRWLPVVKPEFVSKSLFGALANRAAPHNPNCPLPGKKNPAHVCACAGQRRFSVAKAISESSIRRKQSADQRTPPRPKRKKFARKIAALEFREARYRHLWFGR